MTLQTRTFAFVLTLTLTLDLLASPGAATAEETKDYEAFSVQVTGEGRPILLIPGLSSSASVWDDTVAALRDRYQLHVFNLAGFAGLRPPSAEKVGTSFLSYQKGAIQSYIADHQLENVVVIGHSLGGFLSLWLAAERAAGVTAVINVDGLPSLGALFGNGEQPQEPASFDPAAMVRGMANNADWHARILSDMQSSDPMTAGRAMGELMRMDIRPQLANIQIPVLTLGAPAQGMPFVTYEQSKINYQRQLETIPDPFNHQAYAETSKHFIMADEPEWLHQQIDHFLNQRGQ